MRAHDRYARTVSRALDDPVVVAFPLRGEGWVAVTTPAARIPSHGVDILGQRYAYDFVKVDDRPGLHVHPASTLRAATLGGRTRECYAWGRRSTLRSTRRWSPPPTASRSGRGSTRSARRRG
nr:hypothetical protein GCM10025699_15040 [Microbacterium flavescens]